MSQLFVASKGPYLHVTFIKINKHLKHFINCYTLIKCSLGLKGKDFMLCSWYSRIFSHMPSKARIFSNLHAIISKPLIGIAWHIHDNSCISCQTTCARRCWTFEKRHHFFKVLVQIRYSHVRNRCLKIISCTIWLWAEILLTFI